MLKSICLILSLLMVLLLFGCSGADGQKIADPVPTETATASLGTGEENPTAPTVTSTILTDAIAVYDTTATETIVSESDNSAFHASYIHLFTQGAHDRTAFDGQLFWVSQEGTTEMMQGNHYDVYALEDGRLVKLENKYFSESYTLFGTTVRAEFSYAVYGDAVHITYAPVRRDQDSWVSLWDASRGVNDCLLRFELQTDQGYICYFAAVDLETGELRDFLSWADPTVFVGTEMTVSLWKEDDSLLLKTLSEDACLYLDVSNKSVVNYDLADLSKDASLYSFWEVADGFLCRAYTDQFLAKGSVWKLDSVDGTVTPILSDVRLDADFPDDPCVVYRNEDGVRHVYNGLTDEDILLPEAASVIGSTNNFVIFQDSAGAHHIFSLGDKADLVVLLPDGWEPTSLWRESPGGDSLLTYKWDESGTAQILIFNSRTNELIEFRRTNPNGVKEDYINWTEDGRILITSNDRRAFYIYELLGK